MKEKTTDIEYTLVRSGRKTLGIEIAPDGRVTVRAPYAAPQRQIEAMLREKAAWIARAQARAAQRQQTAALAPLTREELRALGRQAAEYLPQRAAHYARLLGVDYGRITVRAQRTRWGSCSAQGHLSFNCLLMLAPGEVIDSVVVHELCHRKEMNHSERFYAEVLRAFPEYEKWNAWLKKNGTALMRRMTDL